MPDGERCELCVVVNRRDAPSLEPRTGGAIGRMHVWHQPQPGKSRAANLALARVEADWLLWADDDLDYDPGWAAQLAAALRGQPDSAVTGKVLIAEHLRRDWMEPLHRAGFGDLAMTAEPQTLLGGSMGFSRAAAQRLPGFDPELGPGTKLGAGEDTLYADMLRASGQRLRFVPEALAVHHFAPGRLQVGALRQTAFRQGRSMAYIHHHWLHLDALQTLRMKTCVIAGCGRDHLWAGPERWLSRRTVGSLKLAHWGAYYFQMRRLRGQPRRYRRTLPFAPVPSPAAR